MVRESSDPADAPLDDQTSSTDKPLDDQTSSTDKPLDDQTSSTDKPLDKPLDDELAAAFDSAGGDDRATVRDWVDAATDAVAASALDTDDLAVEHLCHVDDGDHVARVAPDGTDDADDADAETYRFQCFLDGLVLAGLVDEPVEVTTPDPETGDLLTFAGTLDDVATDAAVVSLGVADRVTASSDATATDEADRTRDEEDCGPDCCGGGTEGGDAGAFDYDTVCPYVNAFATREAYESWGDRVDAATTAIPPATAIAVARELAT